MKMLKILVLDDEQGYREEISEFLKDSKFSVVSAKKPSRALEIIRSQPIDIAIIDLKLPDERSAIHEKNA